MNESTNYDFWGHDYKLHKATNNEVGVNHYA